jgi:hypothetical protein
MERTTWTHGRITRQFDLLGAVSSAGERSQATIQGTPWDTLTTPGAVLRKKVVLRVNPSPKVERILHRQVKSGTTIHLTSQVI